MVRRHGFDIVGDAAKWPPGTGHRPAGPTAGVADAHQLRLYGACPAIMLASQPGPPGCDLPLVVMVLLLWWGAQNRVRLGTLALSLCVQRKVVNPGGPAPRPGGPPLACKWRCRSYALAPARFRAESRLAPGTQSITPRPRAINPAQLARLDRYTMALKASRQQVRVQAHSRALPVVKAVRSAVASGVDGLKLAAATLALTGEDPSPLSRQHSLAPLEESGRVWRSGAWCSPAPDGTFAGAQWSSARAPQLLMMSSAGLAVSPASAAGVKFSNVAANATVASPVHLEFAVDGMTVKPAGREPTEAVTQQIGSYASACTPGRMWQGGMACAHNAARSSAIGIRINTD